MQKQNQTNQFEYFNQEETYESPEQVSREANERVSAFNIRVNFL